MFVMIKRNISSRLNRSLNKTKMTESKITSSPAEILDLNLNPGCTKHHYRLLKISPRRQNNIPVGLN